MRIYFAPCGIGLGHASRLLPIAEQFRAAGAATAFSTYQDAVPLVSAHGFQVYRSPSIRFEHKSDGSFDLNRTIAKGTRNLYNFLMQIGFEMNNIESFRPSIVVSDSRLTPIVAARMLEIPRILLINQLRILIPHRKSLSKWRFGLKSLFERIGLEVFSSLWRECDTILVPDFPIPYTISKANLEVTEKQLGRVRFIGPIVSQRPEQHSDAQETKKKMGLDDKRPLVYVNYNGTRAEKVAMGEFLEPQLSRVADGYDIVISRGIPSNESKALAAENVVVYNWVPNRYDLLKACDVFLSNCGHTSLAEAMYFGIPTLLVPNAGHSERVSNAQSAADMGMGILLKQQFVNEKTLRSSLDELTTDGKFKQSAQRVAREVAGYDAVNEATEIIKAYET